MYIPTHFREDSVEAMHAAIRAAGLATMLSMTPDGLLASHLPLLLDPDPAPYGTLVGHFARANPHAATVDPSVQTLVIFQGPEGYITPSYYATKQETGKVVPTWNYIAIHAYGTLETFDDPAHLLAELTRLTRRFEAERQLPWEVSDAPADYVAGMLRGIVGVRLRITRLEGKVKMSQNRSPADRNGVAAGLVADGRPDLAEAVERAGT